jgi:hypothetical protein
MGPFILLGLGLYMSAFGEHDTIQYQLYTKNIKEIRKMVNQDRFVLKLAHFSLPVITMKHLMFR